MNKVKLSELVGHTPVTVRHYEGGQELTFKHISERDGECTCIMPCGHRMTLLASDLVEVLPAKQTPTPLTDAARQYDLRDGVPASLSRRLELERAALLALVERVAEQNSVNIGPVTCAGLIHDARALLAQLSWNAPACVSTASAHRA